MPVQQRSSAGAIAMHAAGGGPSGGRRARRAPERLSRSRSSLLSLCVLRNAISAVNASTPNTYSAGGRGSATFLVGRISDCRQRVGQRHCQFAWPGRSIGRPSALLEDFCISLRPGMRRTCFTLTMTENVRQSCLKLVMRGRGRWLTDISIQQIVKTAQMNRQLREAFPTRAEPCQGEAGSDAPDVCRKCEHLIPEHDQPGKELCTGKFVLAVL